MVDQMTGRDEANNKPRFRVDWTINPTHIIAFIGAIIGGIAFAYGLRADLQEANGKLERLVIELKSKNELQDTEIKQIRDSSIVARSEEIQFRSEMRISLAELNKILTDLRISYAERSGGVAKK